MPNSVPEIEMHDVDSSAIARVGHHPATNTTRVQFHSGATYDYRGISPAEHEDFRLAKSIGGHFNRYILPKGGVRVE
jgi:KTSC domain